MQLTRRYEVSTEYPVSTRSQLIHPSELRQQYVSPSEARDAIQRVIDIQLENALLCAALLGGKGKKGNTW